MAPLLPSRIVTLGGATLNQIPMDWANNTSNILAAIDEAKRKQVAILCLPELCITGYGCEDMFLSDWLAERAWKELQTVKLHCTNITVAVGLPVRIEGITYNGVCVISNGEILGITFKQNLANDGVHYEPRWFTAWQPNTIITLERNGQSIQVGDLVYDDVHSIRFGFEICEDGWRKEKRPGYRLRDRQVDLILNPSASHFAMGKSLLREEEVVRHGSALFNCVYIFTNLLGNEAGRMIYDGDIIIAQHGKLIAVNERLSFHKTNVLSCVVDIDDPANTKALPSTDSKDKNEEVVKATSLALYDYLRKSKSKGYVLSLSGGADSSMCAVLVAEMVRRASLTLGWATFCQQLDLDETVMNSDCKKAVHALLTCAYQATNNSSSTTLHAAQQLAESIGAGFHHWNIQAEVDSYTQKIEHVLQRKTSWETDDVSLQNIQARTRSPIIWMLANIKRAILLTTSNRSEGDVGYATMDGDTSGSLAPIAGIHKTFILQWLRWAEQTLGYTGLNPVNNLQPTAELRPLERNQTDESDLMPYTVLARIEQHGIYERLSPVDVFKTMQADYPDTVQLKNHIKKFFKLWSINQWKRERFAPSFHLDEMNVDPRSWCRFPILSSGFAHELEELENI
jgi:NAD+ synthase (glutamine-hydrolysing)